MIENKKKSTKTESWVEEYIPKDHDARELSEQLKKIEAEKQKLQAKLSLNQKG